MDLLHKIDIGGGQYADISLVGNFRSDRKYAFLLEDSKYMALHPGRHRLDLIEEQGSALCRSELSLPSAPGCAGKSAFDISKQLSTEQFVAHCSTVNGNERFRTTYAGVVNSLREHLLPGSRFTCNKNGIVSLGNAFRPLQR